MINLKLKKEKVWLSIVFYEEHSVVIIWKTKPIWNSKYDEFETKHKTKNGSVTNDDVLGTMLLSTFQQLYGNSMINDEMKENWMKPINVEIERLDIPEDALWNYYEI